MTAEQRATRSILDSFYGSIPGFGPGGGRCAKSSSGSGFGVYGVGLAPEAAQLAVRTVHLYHLDTCCGQMTGQAGAVAAGAFHTDLGARYTEIWEARKHLYQEATHFTIPMDGKTRKLVAEEVWRLWKAS